VRTSKQDELVEKALIIFNRNGFHATGMDMLARQTGISKTSMYKYFATKEDLILATLKLRDEKFLRWFTARIEKLATTPDKQLLAIFDVLAEWFTQPGFSSCMFIKAAAEYQSRDHPIHQQAARHKKQKLAYITKLAKTAKYPNPTATARHLMLLIEGATVTAHIGFTKNPAGDAKSAAQNTLAIAEKTA